MPVLDFDMGLAVKLGDIYPSPGLTIEFMPEELFERKRIVDKLTNQDTFSFLSFWRTGFIFDISRWDPATMFEQNEGYYNDVSKSSATLFNLYPLVFDYSFIFWDTKREMLDYYETLLFKKLYRNPITSIRASDAAGLQMNCYMDFDYKLEVTDEYLLEKDEKVPYFKGKFGLKLEGWLYDITDTGASGSGSSLIEHVHMFTYNENHFYMDGQWIPGPGGPSGAGDLPAGQPEKDLAALDLLYADLR